MIACKKGLEFSSFGNTISKFLFNLNQNFFTEILQKIQVKYKDVDEVFLSPKLPKTKISKKKISLENEENMKDVNEKDGKLYDVFGKIQDEKLFIFFEKLFTLISSEKENE